VRRAFGRVDVQQLGCQKTEEDFEKMKSASELTGVVKFNSCLREDEVGERAAGRCDVQQLVT
jgi:hypothetical protein